MPKTDKTDMEYRGFANVPGTTSDENRSVDAVLATDAPVLMFDWERGEVVPEVLPMEGLELPENRQVPLLDSHNRYSTDAVLGSIRDFRIEGGKLIGRNYFAKRASDKYEMVRDGHITDMSAGYTVTRVYVPKGQKATLLGREWEGPLNVGVKWRLREGSLVPIGADEQAKMRGFDPAKPRVKETEDMNEQLRALLVEQGMDPKLTDEQAVAWAKDNLRSAVAIKAVAAPLDLRLSDDELARIAKTVSDQRRREEEAVKAWRADVDGVCALVNLPEEREACYAMSEMGAVRKHLQEKLAANAAADQIPGGPMVVGEAQRDKHVGQLQTALFSRIESTLGPGVTVSDEDPSSKFRAERAKAKREELFPAKAKAPGWETFRHAGLLDIARECLHADGVSTRGLTREQIAMAALGFGDQAGVRAGAFGGAYHVTGSFPKLTQDAMNKSMQVGYAEAPATWEGPMRMGASVPDFKTIHRMRLGAIANLPAWPDNSDPIQSSFADADEPYAVEAYSTEVQFSFRLIVNDDMSVLTRVPQMLGVSAGRTVNAQAWAVVTANAPMSDSVALFSAATGARKRSNLTTGAATPTTSTLQTMTNLMMQMRGENTPEGAESADILSLRPKYIVGPAALLTTIMQLVKSVFDPASNIFQRYNTAAYLTPVIEPLLDATSTTAWYLFAGTDQIDTIEVTFLQGQETPRDRSWSDPRNLSQMWSVVQTFGVKALNHRGLQRHDGV